jgi:hypothetical protein
MKILEILEPVHKTYTATKPLDRIRAGMDPDAHDPKRLGTGLFATVRTSKNPFEVIKKTKLDNNGRSFKDGYPAFVKAVIEFQRTHKRPNPYFPVFTRVNEFKKDADTAMVIKMERLRGMYDLESSDIKQMITFMFSKTRYFVPETPGVYDLIDNVEAALKYPDEKGVEIADFRFQEAVDFLNNYKKQNPNLRWDIHSGNLMWRRTPQGPHLVITDPWTENV